jgi:uncharacterized protein
MRARPFAIGLGLVAIAVIGIFLWWDQSSKGHHYDLLAAAASGSQVAAATALDSGAQINARFGGTGQTALHRAAFAGDEAMVLFLISRGADPNVADSDGNTPLLAAAYKGHLAIVQHLIKAGAKVDAAEQQYGATPLLEATRKGHVPVVKALVEAGADPKIRDKSGKAPIDIAQGTSDPKIRESLSRP